MDYRFPQRIALRRALVFAVVAIPAASADAAPAKSLVVPKDGMVIRHSVTLKPGVYALPKGLIVSGNGITLEAKGVNLIGSGTGQAVFAKGVTDMTVRGLAASRYKWGVKVRGGKGVVVENCRIRDTVEEVPDEIWLDIWKGPEQAYGAAIFLWDVTGGRVAGNDVQHQQNGISVYNCTGLTVERNNASFQSGWGIHLYSSSDNTIQDNLADWCNRIHKRGERYYYPGADATGMLMIYNSSRNTVRRNFFRGGGDGVFIAGYKAPEVKAPCNDNVFEDNDCSYSPNNAFESTFCTRNVFRNNRASMSNYGFWLGYSTDNIVEDNEIRQNRIAGIAIEHGLRNALANNRLTSNRRGIALWSRAGAPFLDGFPDQAASADSLIRGNTFMANGIGFLSRRDGDDTKANPHGDTLTDNTFYGNGTGALLLNTDRSVLRANRFQANTTGLRIEGGQGTVAAGNYFVDEPVHAWSDQTVTWMAPTGNFWSGAEGASYAPGGPAPGTDTSPLKEAPPLPAGRLYTEDDVLRGTPR